MKYTPAGGEIWVRVNAGGGALLEVQDNGAGISAEMLPRIFDLFARGEFGLQRSPGGLGIGLTLVRRIAELHGGRAEAASAGPGRGTTFTVTLRRIAAPQANVQKQEGLRKSLGSRRIVLIEDNDDAREGLRMVLEASGHQVYAAADGLAGVAKAVEVKPEVVLIDLGLPGLDGYQVAARIRTTPECCSATLIALTGYGHDDFRDKAKKAGFHSYIVKPVETAALETAIAAHTAA